MHYGQLCTSYRMRKLVVGWVLCVVMEGGIGVGLVLCVFMDVCSCVGQNRC